MKSCKKCYKLEQESETLTKPEKVAVVNPEEDESPDISGESIAAMQDVADFKTSDSTMTLEERESMFNVDQKCIFNNIK